VTAEELAAMIDEAAWVARRLPARGARPAGYKTDWPDVVHDKWAAYGWEAARSAPERPTARQIDLLDREFRRSTGHQSAAMGRWDDQAPIRRDELGAGGA
jgi:hypothetical protein